MEVELLIRGIKPKTKEREEEERQRKLFQDKYGIDPTDELEPEKYDEVFYYDYMTFDIKDVKRFNRVDDNHTSITFDDGSKFAAKVSYQHFQSLWEGLLGRRILTVKDNQLQGIQVKDY